MRNECDIPRESTPCRTSIAIAVSAAIAGTGTITAQAEGLEEITVTATKRSESVQDIPMAVTAFSDEEIVREGFKQLADYVGEIPSLEANKRSPGSTTLVMRGCATSGTGFADNPTTALYLDENPISAGGLNPDPWLIDIKRVESLSGPQGTLFGAASQCGTLRVITNKPDTEERESWFDATPIVATEHSDDLGYEVSGMTNIPLIKGKLGLRLSGFWSEEAGYIDNILVDSPGTLYEAGDAALLAAQGAAYDNSANVEDDINSATTKGMRGALRWTPTDDLTLDLMANYQHLETDGHGDIDLERGIFARAGYNIGDYEQVRFNNEKWDDEWYQVALTTEANLDKVDVTITGAYMNRDTRYDTDGTPYQISNFEAGAYAGAFIYDFGSNPGTGRIAGDTRGDLADEVHAQRWTFEARVATADDLDSRWSGILGIFYANKDENEVFKSNIRGMSDGCAANDFGNAYYQTKGAAAYNTGCAYGTKYLTSLAYFYTGRYVTPTDNWFSGYYDEQFDEKAIFGEMGFDITDRLALTLGARWFEYNMTRTRQTSWFQTTDVASDEAPPDCNVVQCYQDGKFEATESDWVPKINLSYHYDDDKMVYWTYSEGFRRGGVNGARNGEFAPGGAEFNYTSDTLDNYEAGFKTTWMDDTLRVNLTAYHMIWNNIIIETKDPVFFTVGNVNLSEAEINGLELSTAWAPSDSWDVRGTLGYNNAETSEASTIFEGSAAGPITVGEGERLPLSPELKTSLRVTYTFQREVLGATPYMSGTWLYQGDSLNSLGGIGTAGGLAVSDVLVQDDFNILNFRAGMEADNWTATMYISNLTDERGELFFNPNRQPERLSVTRPRSIGMNFRYYFGKNK